MTSWKTTVAGLVAMTGPLIIQFWPEQAKLGGFIAALGIGALGMFSRDNDKSSEDVGAKPLVPPRAFSAFLLAGGLAVLMVGCTTVIKSEYGLILKEHMVGFRVRTTSPQTQSPDIFFGEGDSTIALFPVRTNQLFAPAIADTFDLGGQAAPFGVRISENMGIGSVQTGTNGDTTIKP